MSDVNRPSAEWVVFRTTLTGRDDYGTPMAKSIGLTDSMLEEGRRMVRECHSDSEPAPKATQYYCWITTDKNHWALMSSGLNEQFEERRDRAGREYIVVFMTDSVCQTIYPEGKPIYAIKHNLFTYVARIIDGGGKNPVTFDAERKQLQSRLSLPYAGKPFRKRFDQTHVEGMVEQLANETVVHGSRPSTFATWWSYTRPVLNGVFDSDMRTGQPEKVTVQVAVKQATDLATAVSAIQGLDANPLYLEMRRETRQVVDSLQQLGQDTSSSDASWTTQLSSLSHRVSMLAADLEKLGAAPDGTATLVSDNLLDLSERYTALSDSLMRMQRPVKTSFSAEPAQVERSRGRGDDSTELYSSSRSRLRKANLDFQFRLLGSIVVCLVGFGILVFSNYSPRSNDETKKGAQTANTSGKGDGDPGGRHGKPGDDKPSGGKQGDGGPGDDRPGDDRPGSGRPGSGRPGGGRPGGGRPGGGRPGGGKPGSGKPGSGKPGSGKPVDNKSGDNKSGDNMPSDGKPLPIKIYDSLKVPNEDPTKNRNTDLGG